MDNNYSLSDVAALLGNKGFGNGDGLGWLILILLFMGGIGGWNRGPVSAGPAVPPHVATTDFVQDAVNNQSINAQLQGIALSSADNNYQNAQLITGQTNTLMQQGYTNQLAAIQGFNAMNMGMVGGFNDIVNNITAQTNLLASKMDQLSFQQERCCCEVKTQMLQDRLDDRNRELLRAQNELDNARQSQFILGSAGRYVAWAGSGTQTAGVVSA